MKLKKFAKFLQKHDRWSTQNKIGVEYEITGISFHFRVMHIKTEKVPITMYDSREDANYDSYQWLIDGGNYPRRERKTIKRLIKMQIKIAKKAML